MNELVLIVEDEKDVAQLLRYNLQKAGYRTVVAADGDHALSVARFSKPDLILLDLMLPERDGWDVCRRLRTSEFAASTPIIMITALDGEEFRLRGLQEGADDYIPKPFSVREVVLRVKKLLDRSSELRSHRIRRTETETQLSYLVHELKNSLSVIDGYTVLASEREGASAYLERISSATEHMDQVLSDASVLVRIEKGALPAALGPLALDEVIAETLEAFRVTAGDKGIRLHGTADTGSRIWGEQHIVRQILTNLLSNAIKYNRDGGKVDVTIEDAPQRIVLCVKDTGIGMTQEEAAQLFQDFFRVRNEKTRHILGSGLGLSIVKKLAQLYDGQVGVESKPDVGSTFTVVLTKPAAAPAKN